MPGESTPTNLSAPMTDIRSLVAATLLLSALGAHAAPADEPPAGLSRGKLLLTQGVSSIDGAAGGGLTPWAVIGSYATEHEVAGTAFVTRVTLPDYALTTYGAAIGISDRVEVSFARQEFNASVVVPDTTLKLDIAGLKVKVAGDAILEADTWIPQVALGLEYKHLNPGEAVGGVLDSVAAKRDGVDFYVTATKLFLAPGVLVNGTLRATRANQNGLLGFGSADKKSYSWEPEISLAKLLRKDLAVGVEYRFKPNNLGFAGAPFEEQDWKDIFIAWAPSKHVSLTGAWVDLGNIVGHEKQHGAYVSLQLAF